ncbi:MAG: cob(I)yrinic acid a,c-diamide adenosyltransferase [Candidatus Vogelbacteria bacterium]|nr:cob(I)yrinic acid a,c-diamide adenosyltransferase [Candidatus Vogelbacteria bacterium]
MLYTRKGDGGTTKFFGCDQRFSKSSAVAEALGAVDELNSLLGFVKAQFNVTGGNQISTSRGYLISTTSEIIDKIQHNLFIVQAELAGAKPRTQRGAGRGKALTISSTKVTALEKIIDGIEKELPPIKTFFVPGGAAPAALLDYARTVCRRAERRVIAAREKNEVKLSDSTAAYLNRLSSLLYALARLVNHLSGIKEEPPHYQ